MEKGDTMKTYVKGIYRRSIFTSDAGYTIGIMKVKETDDEEIKAFVGKTVTFTGYFHELTEDDLYEFKGEAVDHPKYGFQYMVESYERVKPQDKEGAILFLSSDLFKGVGEKLAIKVVNHLGDKTIEKILEDPSCLSLVPGLTKKKADLISSTLRKYEESSSIMIYLTELGFSMREALLIYNTYKDQSISKVEYDVYALLEDLKDLTFSKVDSLRHKLDIKDDDDRRVRAAILYVMQQRVYQSGDTYLEKEEIYRFLSDFLHFEISLSLFDDYLSELSTQDKIIHDGYDYYLSSIYEAQSGIVYKVTKLLRKEVEHFPKIDAYIKDLEKANDLTYSDSQKEAIKGAIENPIFLITGGPGTGKTTIIKAILDVYCRVYKIEEEKRVERISLLAPTGRASKRMSEGAIFPASTIHRFLKWNKDTGSFAVNELNKDKSTLVIIDEMSMIDLELMDHLLKGLTDDLKLVLVGDFNQLPSVGPGQVLKDLVECEKIKRVELDLLYRQDKDSYIPYLAKEIKENSLSDFEKPKPDYQFLECRDTQIIPSLKQICIKAIEHGYDYKKLQIMAPMYRGLTGIDHLNTCLQEIFNPPAGDKVELVLDSTLYREQDKILELVNMPEENIFNGDIGIISKIVPAKISESKKNEIYVDFDGNVVKFLPKDFYKIKHGFVISIHKSQGSEFDFVILPITHSYNRMLYRKLIYTAVTRAKKKLVMIGEKESFIYSVSNNNEYMRKTKFCEKLQGIRIT